MELRDGHWASDVTDLVDDLRRLAPALKIRDPRGLLRSWRRSLAVLLASVVFLTATHWLLVRLDVLRAESLRLLPAMLTGVFAVLLLAHLVARRRNP
jgi:hypothetical protein